MGKEYLKDKKYLKARERALKRDKYLCCRCKRFGKKVGADTTHHIYPVEFYPQWKFSLWNLISLCSACHNKMHHRETHELTAEGLTLQMRVSPLLTKIKNSFWEPVQGDISPSENFYKTFFDCFLEISS